MAIIHRIMTDRPHHRNSAHPYSQCPPMFDAPLWRDYFVMVGGGGAALTGLVFVAMSQHLSVIASDPTHRHRHRARTILTALTAVFVRRAPWTARIVRPR